MSTKPVGWRQQPARHSLAARGMKTASVPYRSAVSVDSIRSNFTRVEMKNVTIWFSYKTPIAYRDDVDGLVVIANQWSNTTGRHLNAVDGGNKKERKTAEQFEAMYQVMLARHSL